MTEVAILLKNKDKIIQDLFEWAETFIGEVDEDREETTESYNYVFDLFERFDKAKHTEKDLEEILFHIEQINYNEEKIILS